MRPSAGTFHLVVHIDPSDPIICISGGWHTLTQETQALPIVAMVDAANKNIPTASEYPELVVSQS